MRGLIFCISLLTFFLGPDGHMSLSGDEVPVTQPDSGNYFETQAETVPETEESKSEEIPETESKTELENTTLTAVFSEEQYQAILSAVRSLSSNDIEETEPETEFNPEISVLSLNESGLSNVPKSGVAVYRGRFNGTEGFLMYPYDLADSLTFDDSGLLMNVGSATVTGRFFTGDTLDLSDYRAKLYLLNSVYAAPTQLYQYGSLGVMRTYRVYNSSLTYDSVYGNFYVSEVYIYEPQNDFHKTYLLVAGIFFVACAVLIFRRKSG